MKGEMETECLINIFAGPIGARTYNEWSRGNAVDHTQASNQDSEKRIPAGIHI